MFTGINNNLCWEQNIKEIIISYYRTSKKWELSYRDVETLLDTASIGNNWRFWRVNITWPTYASLKYCVHKYSYSMDLGHWDLRSAFLGLGILSNSLEHSHYKATSYSVQWLTNHQGYTRRSRFTSFSGHHVDKLSSSSPIPWQVCESFCINRNICVWVWPLNTIPAYGGEQITFPA